MLASQVGPALGLQLSWLVKLVWSQKTLGGQTGTVQTSPAERVGGQGRVVSVGLAQSTWL